MTLVKTAIKITSSTEIERIKVYYETVKEMHARMKAQHDRQQEELKPISERMARENEELINEFNSKVIPMYIEVLSPYVANPMKYWAAGEYSVDFGYFEQYGDAYIVHNSILAGSDSFRKEESNKILPFPPNNFLN